MTRRPPWVSLALTMALLAGLVVVPFSAPSSTSTPAATATSERWPADAVIYHVFVDRFADGDAPGTQVGVELPGPGEPGYDEALTDWMGGDLAGLHARLDHIVATGANTLWLSPVTPGPFFHGYHPTDLTDVDPRFGDVDELRALVTEAQQRGLKVIYDLVLNHTSDRHPWFVAAQADCDGSPFVDYYRFRDCPERYAAFAGLDELPQLDLDHPPLRALVLDEVLSFWLDDIGVDGFRLDHVEGPSRAFWQALRDELDQRWPGTLLLGEVWASQPIIDSYADVLDAATAFPLRDRLEVVFAGDGDVRAVSTALDGLLDAATGRWRDDTPRPATYLSSHDQPRFAWLAGGDADRLALGYAALLTLPGLPVIYYGDELGLSQSDALPDGAPFADRWFREPMPWAGIDGRDGPLLREDIAALARLRTEHPALHDDASYLGTIIDGPVWGYVRTAADGGSALLVLLNTSAVTQPVTLPAGTPLMRAGELLVGGDAEGLPAPPVALPEVGVLQAPPTATLELTGDGVLADGALRVELRAHRAMVVELTHIPR